MLRRHRVQLVVCQRLPQRVPVRLLPQRRSHQCLQALLRILVVFLVQQQVLRAGFRPDMPLPCRPGLPDFLQPQPRGKVDDIHRRFPCRPGKIEQPVHSFRLSLCRAADRMPPDLRLSLPDKLFPQKGDDPVVLAVAADQDVLLPGPLQHLHQFQVVQPAVIGHINLEAGNALLPGDLCHVVQHLVVHMLQHPVKPVIHRGIPVRQPVVFLHLMPWAASLRPEGHMINDGSRSAAGRRRGAGVKIVNSPGDPDVQVHMRVDIHCPRQDQFSLGIGHIGTGRFHRRQALRPGNRQDPAVFNQQVPPEAFLLRHDRPAANPCSHFPSPPGGIISGTVSSPAEASCGKFRPLHSKLPALPGR